MKKVKLVTLAVLTALTFSCEKEVEQENQAPEEDCNDYCKCGIVTDIKHAQGELFNYTIENNCSGNTYVIQQEMDNTWQGDNMCLNKCW